MKTTITKIGKSVSNFIKSENFGRIAMVMFFIGTTTLNGFADDAFTKANGMIEDYIGPVKTLLKTIAAILALVGAFNVYHKMTNGDQDVKKTIMLTIGGCVAMLALSEALPAFFGK